MTWQQLNTLIQSSIRPGVSRILKADGIGRRLVTSNNGSQITMITGATTRQTKSISYEMIRHGFAALRARQRFDSADFRRGFPTQYQSAPCRFSMTGGVMVELGVAVLVPAARGKQAVYVSKRARPNGARGTDPA